MSIHSNLFTHDLDRAALQALKAIPGFTPLLKAYMKVWSEQQFRIQNMATNLRISEKQMPHLYNMLPPICEKLGIEVPELYLKLDVYPNAYTSGDTKPFIVITSGLLDTFPESLIPSVLAHECGHIACHHVLYSTMGRMILDGATSLLGLSELVSFPIQAAFYYWMRCSELSADRAAAICDGTADKVIESCMRFAGFPKEYVTPENAEAFMEQALEYRELVAGSKWNKTLEFLMFSHADHPLNAVRAHECKLWHDSDPFGKIINYLEAPKQEALVPYNRELPLAEPSKHYIGQNAEEVAEMFRNLGFINVQTVRQMETDTRAKTGQVLSILINGNDSFEMASWHPANSEILIVFFEPPTDEELAAQHPGEIRVPDSAKRYIGRDHLQVINELKDAGFTQFYEDKQRDFKSWLSKEGSILRITIAGQAQFEKGAWFKPDSVVRITYNGPADGLNKLGF